MIIFSSRKLETALANDSLDSWAKAKYIIFVIAMYSTSGPFFWFVPSLGPRKPLSYHLASFVFWLLSILVIVHGVKKCFRTNKTADGKDFVERLAALYVPITFQFIPVALLIFGIAAFLIAYIPPIDKETKYHLFSYLALFMSPILFGLFFAWLNRSFERLAKLIRERNRSS